MITLKIKSFILGFKPAVRSFFSIPFAQILLVNKNAAFISHIDKIDKRKEILFGLDRGVKFVQKDFVLSFLSFHFAVSRIRRWHYSGCFETRGL